MSDKPEILVKFAEIIKKATAGDLNAEVTAEKSFADDLELDSLTMVEIALMVEEGFGVKIPENELADLETVGEVVDYIAERSPAS